MSFWRYLWRSLPWLPAYARQRLTGRAFYQGPVHLIFALADHFEPAIVPGSGAARASRSEQERRLERWCREYPKAVENHPDSDGRFFRHTYFYPAEQYDADLIDRLAEHCRAGWGEIEIHLHHGARGPDTSENTRRGLVEFRDTLAACRCLSRLDGTGAPRYAFVHGNFALANSARGRYCGVDEEMQILADTGCYADFTLPSAPNVSQTPKINSIYECTLPLNQKAPHRRGRDLESGRAPRTFPLIVQGPLVLDFGRRALPIPGIENGELTVARPPTMSRLRLWRKAEVMVRGRPEWIFIKLHCHGMDPRDDEAMLGSLMRQFLRDLAEGGREGSGYRTHFVTAREMTNIVLAACDGRDGDPGQFRDYRLKLTNAASSGQQVGRLAGASQPGHQPVG